MLENFLQFDITSLLIVLIFFLILEYRPPWWYRTNGDCSKEASVIPGPATLPFFGTTWTFWFGGFSISRLHEYYDEMHKKYGSTMKEEFLFNVPVISVFEKRDIAKVLKSGGKYPLRPPVEAVAHYRRSRPDRYATMGLGNEQGESWYHLRTTLTPVFTSPKTISSFLPQVEEIVDDWCNLLRQSRDGSNKVSLASISDRLGLELTCALVLGRRMGFLLPGAETDIGNAFAEAVRQHFIGTRDTYYGLPFWKLFPTPSYRKLINSEDAIYALASELIKSADDSTKDCEVFQAILKADVDEREKTVAVIDFISAGIHTLKNSLLFLLYLVAKDSQVQKKIISDEDKSYTKACITESFRLLSTANILARILDEDLELGGYKISAGTPVICHFGIACRNESNFKQAGRFRPERWLNEEKAESVGNAAFLLVPFGAGRRICPGKRFIEHVLPIILENTVKMFEISAYEELQVQFEFLLAPKNDFGLVFNDRV